MIKFFKRLYYRRIYRRIWWSYFNNGIKPTRENISARFYDLTGEKLDQWVDWPKTEY
ncbi:MAG: hypothetical protein J1F67_04980 [Muribaculaceae bacterium]|nr:hypothetical protein [Muribaculaceae bacterium]